MPFGTGTRLYVVACVLPGAYNYPSRLFNTEGLKTADTVALPDMGDAGPSADMTIWNALLDGDRLTSFLKGRGIGDCGQIGEWRIDAAAPRITLAGPRVKGDCDGEGADDPDGWPRVWPKGWAEVADDGTDRRTAPLADTATHPDGSSQTSV